MRDRPEHDQPLVLLELLAQLVRVSARVVPFARDLDPLRGKRRHLGGEVGTELEGAVEVGADLAVELAVLLLGKRSTC